MPSKSVSKSLVESQLLDSTQQQSRSEVWPLLVMLSVAIAPAAQAQTAAASGSTESAAIEEVVVTGSRIVRDGYETPTALTIISEDEIQATAPTNVADFVNQIPSVVGSSTPANSNTSASSGRAGLNVLNLRSFGASRTLVLLDGKRSAGSALDGAVDINTFPQGLVKGVEIVTGGASAAYGSDAVSG
ncbi:MAG: TonB-dependent receptor plug domain-containing protein, partial [Woeseia sp.]